MALAASWLASSAAADGDPASDVLATQSLFLPQDAGLPVAQRAQLAGLLQAAAHRGYQIRVAVIASTSDLGSVTELWRQPQAYAQFLGEELSLVYRGQLLVIMPDGFGVQSVGEPASAAKPAALAGVRITSGGVALGSAAFAAVQRLAAASGYRLELPAAQSTASARGSSDTIAWIVFAIGGALIALAWTASLRARPAGLRPRRASSR